MMKMRNGEENIRLYIILEIEELNPCSYHLRWFCQIKWCLLFTDYREPELEIGVHSMSV